MVSNSLQAESTSTTGVLNWLLEADDPAVRAVALRDLLDAPPDDPDYRAACVARLHSGPMATVLNAMAPEGYWVHAGHSYAPKYTGTYWSMMLLAQLGVHASDDPRIATACARMVSQNLNATGQIATNDLPSHTIDCLQGNICHALLAMGVDDPRLDVAIDWMARTVTGDGIAPALVGAPPTNRKTTSDASQPLRYQPYKCGPNFACIINGGKPCAWGAAKVMLALSIVPAARCTPQVIAARKQGAAFLLGIEPTTAAWPTHDDSAPSPKWWRFGFPVFYSADLLQVTESLVLLGYGSDPRLASTLALIRAKCDANGRWPLEFSYGSRALARFGTVGKPSKWVTLRALRVLRRVANEQPPRQ